jgi:hypothetical protein
MFNASSITSGIKINDSVGTSLTELIYRSSAYGHIDDNDTDLGIIVSYYTHVEILKVEHNTFTSIHERVRGSFKEIKENGND